MYSVSSEAPTNLSFQAAPQRSARSDQSSGADSFEALVDSNTATDTGNASAAPPAQAQSVPQRRTDDLPATADNTPASDAAVANQQASTPSANPNATGRQAPDANTGRSADGNIAASNTDANAANSKVNLSDSKTGATKTSAKSSSDSKSAPDPATSAQQGGSSVTPIAVAIAIPGTIVPEVPPATPESGTATPPLAIAAAAIAAASAPLVAAPAASSAQMKIESGAATATGPAAATRTTTVPVATAKIDAQTAAGAAVAGPVNQAETSTGATAAIGGASATAVAATAAVAPKTTLLKAPVAAQAKAAASAASDSASGAPDPSATAASAEAAHNNVANVLQQPAVAGQPQSGIVKTAKAETSDGSPAASAAIVAHDHSTAAPAGQAQTGSLDTGLQAFGAIQPQLAAPAPAAPLGAFSVTAAMNAPVPLSGLAIEIAASAKSGKSSFDIRLDPADLGRIDVRIDVDRNGQVTSHLTVEKPETLSMLRQDAPQLQRALDDAGLKTGNGGLQFSLRDQSSSGQNNGNESGRNAQRLVISNDDSTPAVVAGRTYGRMLGSSSGVDIRV